MFGWIQVGSSAFSNTRSNDLVIRTQNAGDRIVMGAGLDTSNNAALYIEKDRVGVKCIPNSNDLFNVGGGAFKVGADEIVHTKELRTENASICNLTVKNISYSNAAATDMTTSNLSTSNLSVGSNIIVGGNVIPTSNLGGSLGTPDNRFTDLYIGGNTFHIGDTTLKQDDNGNLRVMDNNGNQLKLMICSMVQVGDSSTPLRLGQATDGTFRVCKIDANSNESEINVLSNVWASNGLIGVGTAEPSEQLDVRGNVKVGGDIKVVSASNGVGGTALRHKENNELSVNPDNSFSSLTLNAPTVQIPTKLGIGTSPSSTYALDVLGVLNASEILVNGQQIQISGGVGGGVSYWAPSASNIFTNCNVGIGTNTPQTSLDVNGSLNANSFYEGGKRVRFGYWATGGSATYTLSNLAVGKDTASYPLDVAGAINATQVLVNGQPISSGYWTTGTTSMSTLSNIGIGTATPTEKLSVVGNASVVGALSATQGIAAQSLTVNTNVSASNVSSKKVSLTSSEWGDGIVFNNGNNRIYNDDSALIGLIVNVDGGSNLFITSGGDQVRVFVSGSNGFVGVGTSNPNVKLDVEGAINATSYCNLSWSVINNKPNFAAIATTGSWSNLVHVPSFSTVATSGSYVDLTNKPALCNVATTGSWSNLWDRPTLSTVASSGSYNDLFNKPALCNVALSGAWSDVRGKPSNLSGYGVNDLSVFTEKVGVKKTPVYDLDVFGAVNAGSYCNLKWEHISDAPASFATSWDLVNDKPTALSSFNNDLSTFYNQTTFNCNVGVLGPPSSNYALNVEGVVSATGYCNISWDMIQGKPSLATPSWTDIVNAPSNLTSFSNDLVNFPNKIVFSDKVGVGVDEPTVELEVNGAVKATSYCNLLWSEVGGKPAFCNIATSGAYTDLINTPSNLSQFANDITNFMTNLGINKMASSNYALDVEGCIRASGYCNFTWTDVQGKPSFCNIATTGDWNDISGRPEALSSYAVNDLSSFTTDVSFDSNIDVTGAITAAAYCNLDWSMIQNKPDNSAGFSANYADLSNAPALCNVALSASYADLDSNTIPALCNVALSSSYNDLVGKPALCNVALSASWTDLVNTPVYHNVAYTGNYNELSNLPTYCNIALSGSYTDLVNKPSNLSTFSNDLSSFSNDITVWGDLDVKGGVIASGNTSTGTLEAMSNIKTKALDTIVGMDTLSIGNATDTSNIYIGSSSNPKNIYIGTGGYSNKIIEIGGEGDTVRLPGSVMQVNVVNTSTVGKHYVVNSGGGAASAGGAGLQVEEDGAITGYIEVSQDRKSFLMKPPGGTESKLMSSNNSLTINDLTTFTSAGVGIGTNNPTDKVQIQDGSLRLQTSSNSVGSSNEIHFSHSNLYEAKISSRMETGNVVSLDLYTSSNGNSSQKMTVGYNGVGIGTTTPSSPLHVVGNALVAGNLTTNALTTSNASYTCTLDMSSAGLATLGTGSNTGLALAVNGTTKMTLAASGADVSGTMALRNGNSQQLLLSDSSKNYTHAIVSRHNATDNALDAIDFNVWVPQSAIASTAVGTCNVMSITGKGVGIGNSNPTVNLEVTGDVIVSETLTASNITSCNIAEISTALATMNTTVNTLNAKYMSTQPFTTRTSNVYVCQLSRITGSNLVVDTWQNTYSSYYPFVGMGTSNPQYALDVRGSIWGCNYVGITWSMVGEKPTFSTVATTGSYIDLLNKPALCNVALSANYSDLNGKPALCNVATTASWADLFGKPTKLSDFTNDVTQLRDITFSNVGIGKSISSSYKLDVAGIINAEGFMLNGSNIGTGGSGTGAWTVGTDIMTTMCNVAVGITGTPAATLQSGNDIFISASNAAWNNVAGKGLFMRYSTNSTDDAAYIQSTNRSTGVFFNLCLESSNLAIGGTNSLVNPRLYVRNDGNIGVGTNSPTQKLDVIGAIRATSYCNVSYDVLINKPALCNVATTAAYADISGKPALCNLALSSLWNDISGKPTFATVSTSGSYNDLSNKPALLSAFGNDLTAFGCNVVFNGTLGLGGATPNAQLQMANTYANRKIVLYESANNDNQVFGLGVDASLLRLQMATTSADCVVYAGVNSTTSSELMRIKGTGNVGIGVATPATKLDVSGVMRGKGSLVVYSDSSNQGGKVVIGYPNRTSITDEASGTFNIDVQDTTLRIYNKHTNDVSTTILNCTYDGNVGVGVSAPTCKLDVNGTIKANAFDGVTWSAVANKPTFCNVATTASYADLQNKPTALSAFSNDLSTFANNVVFSCNVGIGGSPSTALDVKGTITTSNLSISSGNLSLTALTATSGGTLSVACDNGTTTLNVGCATSATQYINIGTSAATTSITIGNSADSLVVNAGTTTINSGGVNFGSGLINVNVGAAASSGSNCGFVIQENNVQTGYIKTSLDRKSLLMKSPAGAEMVLDLSNGISINDNQLFVGSDGKVGVGTGSPAQKLEVAGSIKCDAVLTTSDQTLKENIREVDGSLDKIGRIKGYYYDWKDGERAQEDDGHQIGCMAQEVLSVLPEAVRETSKGYALNYNALIALCINAINEQQKTIHMLKQKVLV
jgi:Chaperone of endosialidase